MANVGNLGTSPYNKVRLDDTIMAAGDLPFAIHFSNDRQTGIFYKGAGAFGLGSNGTEVLSISTSGVSLPTGGSYPWEFTSMVAITAVANIDFTGLAAGYDYLFSIRNAVPAVAAALRWRVSQSAVFDTGTNYGQAGNASITASTSGQLGNNATVSATAALGGMNVEVVLQNPGSTTEYKTTIEYAGGMNSTPTYVGGGGSSRYGANTTAVDGFRIFFNGQNFAAVGSISVFRRRLS